MKYFIHIPKTAGTSLRAAVFNADRAVGRTLPVYSAADQEMAQGMKAQLGPETLLFGHFSFGFHALFKDARPEYATVRPGRARGLALPPPSTDGEFTVAPANQ